MFKAYCDKCEVEIPRDIANQHDMYLHDGKLDKIRVIIIVREFKGDGVGENHKQLCVKCVREIGRNLLEQIPEPEDGGEETKSGMADESNAG